MRDGTWERRCRCAILLVLLALGMPRLVSAQAPVAGNPDVEEAPAVGAREVAQSGGGFFGLFPRGMALAPIRWSGQLSDQWQRVEAPNSTSTNHFQTLRVSGNTYILHPAIASVGGSLNLSTGTSGTQGDGRSRYSAASGNLGLSALTRTAIPFSLSYSVTDSRTDSILAKTDFRATSLGYQHTYRPFGAPYTANWNISRNKTVSSDSETRSDLYSVALSTGFGEGHSLNWSLSYNDSTATGQFAQDSSILTSYLAHGFSLEYYYRVTNTARLQENRFSGIDLQGAQFAGFVSRTAQVYNAVMWIPSDDYPLTLNSSINLDRTEGRQSQATGAALSLGAQYLFSDQLIGVVVGSASLLDADTGQTRVGALSSSLTYRGDARNLGEFTHRWDTSVGAGLSRRTGGSDQNATLSLSQVMDRGFEVDPGETLSLALGQAGSVNAQQVKQGSGGGQSIRTINLSHSADLSYSVREGERGFGATVRFQDSRSFSDSSDSVVQFLGATGDGDLTIDRLSSINGSIGWGFTRTVSNSKGGDVVVDPIRQSGSGSISYRRSQPFGWRSANYGASFRLNIRRQDENAGGFAAFDESSYLYAYGAEHNLSASIGLLSATLRNDFAWNEGGELTWGLSIRVTRDF